MSEVIATSGQVLGKCGLNYQSGLSGARMAEFIDQAQAFVCAAGRYDFLTNWSTISGNSAIKILTDAVACLAALDVIKYDMSGFTSRTEAQTMLDVNWARVVECINLIRDDTFKTFVIQNT